MNATTRQHLRILLGRPVPRITHDQWDQSRRRIVAMGTRQDPMLDLYVARQNQRRSPLNAMRYGELRQRVVSPVVLP